MSQGAREKRVWLLVLGAFLIAAAVTRLSTAWGFVPYRRHVDEWFLVHYAAQILATHDANPHFFNYPSLPIYLTALLMRVPSWFGPAVPPASWNIPLMGGPITPAGAFAVARLGFSLLSVITLGMIAVIGERTYERPAAWVLSPLLLATSGVVQNSGVNYLNVDIVALLFVASTLATVLLWWERDTYVAKAIVPGILSGLSIAGKYNGGLVLLPAGLAILLGKSRSPIQKLLLLSACAAATFVLCVPYSILDRQKFVRDVLWEIHHYAKGHRNFEGETGIPQLMFYLVSLVRDFGVTTTALALIGIGYGAVRNPRRAVVVLSLPLSMLAHMSTNRVHFLRTVLPVFALLPVFAAGGMLALIEGAEWLRGRYAASKPRVPAGAFRGLVAVLVVAAWGWMRGPSALFDRNLLPDSRNVVKTWLKRNAAGPVIFVAPETYPAMDQLAPLHVRTTAATLADLARLAAAERPGPCYVVAPAYDDARGGKAVNERVAASIRTNGGVVALSVPGAKLAMSAMRGRLPEPVLSPALTVYRLTCGHRAPS